MHNNIYKEAHLRNNILENMHNKNKSHVSEQQPQLLLKMANI